MKGSVLCEAKDGNVRQKDALIAGSVWKHSKKYGITSNDCIHLYNLDKSMTTVLIRPVLQYFHRNRCILITRYTEGTFK